MMMINEADEAETCLSHKRMTDNNILLSICIPTCQRASVLRETLESIVSQDIFLNGNEVEVIISDNASADDTAIVGQEFADNFPGKVVYFRQPSNTGGANFHHVLMLGNGLYRKLHNDNLIVHDGALRPFVDMLREVAPKRPVIALTNGNRVADGNEAFAVCNNLDDLVRNVSFFLTWIGGMGLWREDLALAQGFLNDHTQLAQVDIQCKLVASGRPALALFGAYFISKQDSRGTYNWAEVFGKNYLGILKTYIAAGQLSQASFEQAKKEVLLRHVLPNYLNTSNAYDKRSFFDNLADFHHDDYFNEAIRNHVPLIWRLSNPHNRTEVGTFGAPVSLARVGVGPHSSGVINLLGPCEGSAGLLIGCLVTIDEGVGFVLSDGTPRSAAFIGQATSGNETSIHIGNGAWIGREARILPGVAVGRGAIVEPYSVVTENVPPYSRVCGNPARVVSYRYETAVIAKLCAFDFSVIPEYAYAGLGALFKTEIDESNVDRVLADIYAACAAPPKAAAESSGQGVVSVLPVTEDEGVESLPFSADQQHVPAVLLLDREGDARKVADCLTALAESQQRDLPVIILTIQSKGVPEWTDSRRYLQTSAAEFDDILKQLRTLPEFKWIQVVEAA